VERRTLHLSDDAATEQALVQRAEEKRIALAALAAQGLLADVASIDPVAPMSDAVAAAFHAYIGRTACVLDLVQADDLGREAEALNLPGTDMERPNWRRKVMLPADALWQTPLGILIRTGLAERTSTIA